MPVSEESPGRKNRQLAFSSSRLFQKMDINDPGVMGHSRLAEFPKIG
jgi:hypothetical protein